MPLKYIAYQGLQRNADFVAAGKDVFKGFRTFKKFWKAVSEEYTATGGITAAVVLVVRQSFDDEKLLAVLKGKMPSDYYEDLAEAVRNDDNEAIASVVNELYEDFSDFDFETLLKLI